MCVSLSIGITKVPFENIRRALKLLEKRSEQPNPEPSVLQLSPQELEILSSRIVTPQKLPSWPVLPGYKHLSSATAPAPAPPPMPYYKKQKHYGTHIIHFLFF